MEILVSEVILECVVHPEKTRAHHEYNPMLFPLTYDSFDALVFMNDWTLASVIIPMAFLSLLVLFVAIEVKKGTKNIWKTLFVE